MSALGLLFGDLELVDNDSGAYKIETLAEGTTKGNPLPIEVAIRSLLQDGSIVFTQGYDNRTVGIRVIITAPDSAALAEGEAALFAEVGIRNTLTYTPPDGWGAPTVFDVVTSSFEGVDDDLAEVRGQRIYVVRLLCLPFGRSVDEVELDLTPTSVGTARQQSYSFEVPGSARTEASLHVGASAAVGNTLIYTRPGAQGMIPLRQYRTGGGTVTPDASTVSGAYDDINVTFQTSVPAEVVPPGTYIVLARLRADSFFGQDVVMVIRTLIDGAWIQTSGVQTAVAPDITVGYQIMQVGGTIQIPTEVVVDPTNATIDVGIAIEYDSAYLDEAWLVEIGSGALTWPNTAEVSGISGIAAAEHVWITPPSVDVPTGRLLRGTESDQSDAFGSVSPNAWGRHLLKPGENSAFVVTDATTTAVLDGSCQKRWHTHAGS